jgi:hypothetical protein
MRWNSAWVVKEKEVELKQFLDDSFEQMLRSGEIRRIVERYGVPFYPPVDDAASVNAELGRDAAQGN